MPDFKIPSLTIRPKEYISVCTSTEINDLLCALSKDHIPVYYDDSTILDIDAVYDEMDYIDKDKMIQLLRDGGELPKNMRATIVRSYDEEEFQLSLGKLFNSWNRLSNEECEIINKIANRL